jgi:hypothetical protein
MSFIVYILGLVLLAGAVLFGANKIPGIAKPEVEVSSLASVALAKQILPRVLAPPTKSKSARAPRAPRRHLSRKFLQLRTADLSVSRGFRHARTR